MSPARSSPSCCTPAALLLHRQQWQSCSQSDLCYSCQMVQQKLSSHESRFGGWRFSPLSFPFKLFPLQKWIIIDWSVLTWQWPSTTFSLPSSAAAEAPSESTACSSPLSELFSRPPVCAPSVRHPLELDLEADFRRNKSPHEKVSFNSSYRNKSL